MKHAAQIQVEFVKLAKDIWDDEDMRKDEDVFYQPEVSENIHKQIADQKLD